MDRTHQPFDPKEPVKAYWNLHKKRFSVQQGGLVVGHTDHLSLEGATFKVNKSGRMRVLKEKKKNVHAFTIGTIGCDLIAALSSRLIPVTYNPYLYETFVTKCNEPQEVHTATNVILSTRSGRPNILINQ